jgi:SAM-dependent methyltransferase
VSAPRRSGSARPGGRLADIGQDYERGHLDYVKRLDSAGRAWLRTKPFSAPPTEELALCLRTFAHVVELLDLELGAEVLDVGCGPGWLSEFLARCGYRVTGIDISPDMVEIASARVAALGEIGGGLEPHAEFHAMPVRELPWSNRFDAAILFDTMHHFDDELATLEVIRGTLVPGGQLFIHEGVLPPKGSAVEQRLIDEMERYGTLESPFDPDYLEEVVVAAGFAEVRRFAEVDELIDLGKGRRLPWRSVVRRRYAAAQYNVVHALNPPYVARLDSAGEWRAEGTQLVCEITVTNTGSSLWPVAQRHPFPHSSVTLGPYLPGPQGEHKVELPRVMLPSAPAPGKSVTVELRIPRDAVQGHEAIALDLVQEGVRWFGDSGSEPLVLPVPA